MRDILFQINDNNFLCVSLEELILMMETLPRSNTRLTRALYWEEEFLMFYDESEDPCDFCARKEEFLKRLIYHIHQNSIEIPERVTVYLILD